jgi:hypothetical protein
MLAPCVHLNGTSRDELKEQILEAARAVGRAEEALQKAFPNARDYYILGSEAINIAMKEHMNRHARLRSVRDELIAIYDRLDV